MTASSYSPEAEGLTAAGEALHTITVDDSRRADWSLGTCQHARIEAVL